MFKNSYKNIKIPEEKIKNLKVVKAILEILKEEKTKNDLWLTLSKQGFDIGLKKLELYLNNLEAYKIIELKKTGRFFIYKVI